jgi:hypothetical protein
VGNCINAFELNAIQNALVCAAFSFIIKMDGALVIVRVVQGTSSLTVYNERLIMEQQMNSVCICA